MVARGTSAHQVDGPLPPGSVSQSGSASQPTNANQPWDQFDSEAYLKQHYGSLAELDRLIIKPLGRFLESACRGRTDLDGLDLGSGTNLYPSMAQVLFTRSITFWEQSASNVDWLRNTLKDGGQSWGPQWG